MMVYSCLTLYVSLRVVTTAMLELLPSLHSFGGRALTLIGYGRFISTEESDDTFTLGLCNLTCSLAIFIGADIFVFGGKSGVRSRTQFDTRSHVLSISGFLIIKGRRRMN